MNRLQSICFKESTGNVVAKILEEYSYTLLRGGKSQKTVTKYLDDNDAKAETVYTYDQEGRLIRQKNPDGSLLYSSYNLNGTLNASTDGNGWTTYYRYDGMNRLSQKWVPFDSVNGTIAYSYSSTTYDKASRVRIESNGLEFVNLYSTPTNTVYKNTYYDNDGKVGCKAGMDGVKVRYYYDEDGHLRQENQYSNTSNCNIITYTYNYLGKLDTKTHTVKKGDLYNNSFDDTSTTTLTTSYKYDLSGNLIWAQSPEEYQLDPVNMYAEYKYDNMNRQISVSQSAIGEDGTTRVRTTTRKRYNWEGKVEYSTDAEGYSMYNEYDKRGFLTSVSKGCIIIDRKSPTEQWVESNVKEYYTVKWTPKIKCVNEWKIYVRFNEKNDLENFVNYHINHAYSYADVKINIPAVLDSYRWYQVGSSYTFSKGAVCDVTRQSSGPHYPSIVDAVMFVPNNVQKQTFSYDRAGRLISEVSPNFSADSPVKNKTEYAYDVMGRFKTKTEKYFDTVSNQDVATVTKAYKYDNNGNVVKELDALGYAAGTGTTVDETINTGYGNETKYSMSDQVLTVLDPVSKEKDLPFSIKYGYDGTGRKTSETNGKGVVYKYEYNDVENKTTKKYVRLSDGVEKTIQTTTTDFAGNLINQTDGNSNPTNYTYNAFNKVRTVTYANGNVVRYQYDVNGNLKLKQDTMGTYGGNPEITSDDKIIIYDYDLAGRILKETSRKFDGTEAVYLEYRYDKNGNVVKAVEGNGVAKNYSYDEFNRKISESINVTRVDGTIATHVTKYGYDKNNNLVTITDWRNNIITNVYDPLNRLIEKKESYNGNNTKTIERLEYYVNNLQKKSGTTMENGVFNYVEFMYDKNSRLISTTDPEGGITSKTYDNAGNIESVTDGRGNEKDSNGNSLDGKNHTITYSYDEMNRLVNVKNAKGENTSYAYDDAGNLLVQKDGRSKETTYEYNNINKPIKKICHGGRSATQPYTYNDTLVESYTYYADGSLYTKTDRMGRVTTFEYYNSGKLKSKKVLTTTYSYTYDGAKQT